MSEPQLSVDEVIRAAVEDGVRIGKSSERDAVVAELKAFLVRLKHARHELKWHQLLKFASFSGAIAAVEWLIERFAKRGRRHNV